MSELAQHLDDSPQLLDAAGLQRVLLRLAHEIVERHRALDAVVLVGIPTRGVHLALAVSRQLAALGCMAPPVLVLDPSDHRDDRPRPTAPRPALTDLHGGDPPRIDGAVVIVVDDVMFTGRTVRAALDALIASGRPAAVEVLTLIDRGHRELPFRATYVGKNVPTAAGDRVMVRVRDVDGVDGAWLRRSVSS
jgi:pyrimidine operon attenuation protein/uracil phosphoribosyltransferase